MPQRVHHELGGVLSPDANEGSTTIPNAVFTLPLSPSAFKLYCYYALVCQQGNGNCWDTLRATCDNVRMTRATVIRAREELVDFGLIEIRRPPPLFGPGQRIFVYLKDLNP